jgi:uroporphyrin-III C-methyltransferase / precorrin-2 dehydrogenase / sirohydrochlorin ferrochelatase
MGKQIAAPTAMKLVVHGLRASTPVGIVVNASRKDRELHRGTLGQLADGGGRFAEGPAIILVGDAVAAGDWGAATALVLEQLKVA